MLAITREKALYSLRLYVSAMLVLGFAFWQDFRYPYWTMSIIYVLIQPSGNQTRLKAGHVLIGAVVGAACGVASAVLFSTSPSAQLVAQILFVMAMSLGVFRDRRPRFYAFMLSGITCLLISMPGIATPDAAFDRGVGRVQDAFVAICTFVIVDALLFPREQSSPVMLLAGQWLTELKAATISALRASPVDPRIRLRIVQRAIQLVPVADAASRSSTGGAWQYRVLIAIIERGIRLLLVLNTLTDLDRSIWSRTTSADHRALREALASWIEEGCKDDAQSARLRQRLRTRPAWAAPYTLGAARDLCYFRYLRAIYAGWRRIQRDHGLDEADVALLKSLRPEGRPVPALIGQADFDFALRGTLSIGLFAVLMGALWSATGWEASGMAIAMLMGVLFCVMSGMADDPVLALIGSAKVVGIAMVTVGFYIQIVFPSVNDFPELALALFPALFMLGLVVQQQGGALFVIVPMALLRIGNGQAGTSIEDLLNSIIGIYIGIGIAVITKMLIQRPPFVEVARRLMRSNRRQLRKLIDSASVTEIRRFMLDALDRFVLLEPRASKLAAVFPAVRSSSHLLREMQIGRSIGSLHRWDHASPNHRSAFASVAQKLTESLENDTDPLQPWANDPLNKQVETQLHALLETTACHHAPVRALIELRVALGELMPAHHASESPRQ